MSARAGTSTSLVTPASDIYTLILNQCPHLKEEEVVRLFRNRHPSEAELVLGEALFREYNLTHSRRFSSR